MAALPASVKIAAAFLFVLAVVATPREAFWAFGVYAAALLTLVVIARVPFDVVARRLMIEVPFVLFAVLMPFVAQGPTVEVAGVDLAVEGLWGAWNILIKGTLGLLTTVVLTATTSMPDLLAGMDGLHVPRAFTGIAGFMVRYADVVAGDMRRMHIARISRGHDPRWLWQARAVAGSAGALFIRSYERGERIHAAMLARGYDGSLPTHDRTTTSRQWATGLLLPAAAAAVCIVAWSL
jgi:cobalt/nickel transport system permease protein